MSEFAAPAAVVPRQLRRSHEQYEGAREKARSLLVCFYFSAFLLL